MLTKAQRPDSTEYAQVVTFLRKRNQQAAATRANSPPQPPPQPEKGPRPPLLTNTARPDEPPNYIGTPRPTQSLSRPRRIPSLATDSFGYPFLRYSKPHPKTLDQMVRKNRYLWESKVNKIIWVEEDLVPSSALEDQWEERMHWEMVRAGVIERANPNVPDEETFVYSAMQSKLWFEWRLENMWQHWTARGEAAHELVQKERVLAAKETGSEQTDDLPALVGGFQESGDKAQTPQRKKKRDYSEKQDSVKVANFDPMPALTSATIIKKELTRDGIPFEETGADPFASPLWRRLAYRSSGRVKRWATRARNGGKGHEDDDNISHVIRAQMKAE